MINYGKIEYDANGMPLCEVCKRSFKRVLTHVRQKHNMNEREYKLMFGLDLKKGICSKESAELTREKTLSRPDLLYKNLIVKGEKSRFKNGDAGRTKDKVQEQTLIRLKEHVRTPEMIAHAKTNGHKLGKSGKVF